MKLVTYLLIPLFCGSITLAAPSEKTLLEAKIQQLVLLKQHGTPFCPEVLDNQTNFVFIFEGANGYCPMNAAIFLRTSALENSLNPIFVSWQSSLPSNQKLLNKIKQISDSENDKKSYSLLTGLLSRGKEISDQSVSGESKLIYYSHVHWKEAISCAQSLEKQAKKINRTITFSAIGHSMGGHAVVKWAQELEKNQIMLDHVLTIAWTLMS